MTVAAGRFVALGAVTPGVPVSVFNIGTTTLAALYADKISGTTVANPVIADIAGNINFFAVPADYQLVYQLNDSEVSVPISVRFDPSESWTG
jgi:hypothetical protein